MKRFEKELNKVLKEVGVPLKCVWAPDDNPKKRAEIVLEEGLIMIYDRDETEAFNSLIHEIIEFRLRSLISPYREIINKLIEGIEQITYSEKEKAIDQVIKDFKALRNLTDE